MSKRDDKMFGKDNITEENIQKHAVIIGRLENKAIIQHIEEIGLTKILERFLSKTELNKYYRSKFELKILLNK